jgi:hypothetical protein
MQSLKRLKVGCAAIICGFSMTAFAADTPGTGEGVWQKHEYSLQFLGFTSTYSCDGLASKVKVLLIAAGARGDVKSTSGGCARGYGVPDKFARADLTFYTLAPAGNAQDPSTLTKGAWRPVTIADRSPREVAAGDCELVEQFRDKVLAMFTTRNLDDRMTCIPNQESGSAINLKFEVFAPMPVAKQK